MLNDSFKWYMIKSITLSLLIVVNFHHMASISIFNKTQLFINHRTMLYRATHSYRYIGFNELHLWV